MRHLIVGPEQHGVVRCARALAEADGGPISAAPTPGALPTGGSGPAHVHFTERVFGPTVETGVAAFLALAAACPDGVTVTLHDVPPDAASPLQRRRTDAYAAVTAAARGVVVNSRHEAARLARITSVRPAVIPLPVDPSPVDPIPSVDTPEDNAQITVLGFVYPGKGHAEVLESMPAGGRLLALGRASEGHDDLVVRLRSRAAELGLGFDLSGFVADDDLPGRLRAAGIPVAPNREVSASGSIATWLAAGRRPLVPHSTYTDELEAAFPGTLWRYDDLTTALAGAANDPRSTWLTPGTKIGLTSTEVVAAYRRFWARPAAAEPAC